MHTNCINERTMREETRTDLEETQSEKASRLEDHFSRLPEELFLYILTTVGDLQDLFQCSLVSKHFASAVFRVRNVCVTVLSIRPRSIQFFDSLSKLTKPKPLVFLEQFKELESVSLECKYLDKGANSSFIKWKVNFSTQFPKFDRFLGILPAAHERISVHSIQQCTTTEFMNVKWDDCFWSSLACYIEWLAYVLMLGTSHNSLLRVTINDSEKEGKMVIDGEHLVRIRSFSEPLDIFQSLIDLKIAGIRWVRLPLSGYGWRLVILLDLNYTTEPYASAIDDIVSWDFEDEEKVLVDAITEIYKMKGTQPRISS